MPPNYKPDYAVGYGKPPEQTRFRKGQSGNRRGRPRGSKNLATLLTEALDEKVFVNDGGKRRKITKREAFITQLVNRSAQADLKAMQMLLGLMQDIERRSDTTPTETTSFSDADQQVLKLLQSRFARNERENDAES